MWANTSLIHVKWVGGNTCFHLRSMRRLARRDVKDIILLRYRGVLFPQGTPNKAVRGSGGISTPAISVKDVKMLVQNSDKWGQVQNI